MAELSANEQDLVSRARALAALRGRQFLEFADCEDPTMALATSMGTAQFLLHELAALVERLSQAEGDGGA